MPPVPSESPLPASEIAPAGSTTRRPRIVVAEVLVIARFWVDDASKTAVLVEAGTAVFQLDAVCQVVLVAPVHVWAWADDAAQRSEATTAVIRTRRPGVTTRTQGFMRSSLPRNTGQGRDMRHASLEDPTLRQYRGQPRAGPLADRPMGNPGESTAPAPAVTHTGRR